ncbi:MAG: hypothetical protein KKE57_04675 [Proteobacteria bacterium]|nr:hypothetical protein [Pseudomonadota bacterium]
MELDSRKELNALNEIRDMALLLSLGNAYLCEEVFLKKIGANLHSTLSKLEMEILSVKKRFPGKFAVDVDTDTTLAELQVHAEQLQDPESVISDKCAAGELGRDLERIVGDLTKAVKTVRSKVEGQLPTPTRRVSFFGFLRWFKVIGALIRGLWKLILKIVIILVIIAIGPMAYLSLTMEETGSYEKEIQQSRAHIQAQREIVSSIERQRKEINEKISALSRPDLSRQERIDIMELMVAIHGLDDKRNKVEVDIADHENRIKLDQEKIEEIERKPLIKRLFRL